MKRAPVVIAMLGALLAGTQSSAIDFKNQSFATKRQAAIMVIDCMKKRMSKDRSISYNQAAREYNAELGSVGGQVLNRVTGRAFKARQYFNASPGAETVPNVTF